MRASRFQNELDQYLSTLLWSETDLDGNPLEGRYTVGDFTQSARERAERDLADFIYSARALKLGTLPVGQLGHDFALTRNRHGAGFWDRGTGELGDALTELSHAAGETHIVEIDDARLDLE